jgi:hypothetical protein
MGIKLADALKELLPGLDALYDLGFSKQWQFPRAHHLWLEDMDYRGGDMTNSTFRASVKQALLVHDHTDGGRALPKHATVYRVALHPDRNDIEVVSIGMERVDMEPDRVYTDFSRLPKWMQERLHVMVMLDDTAPTEHIEGIGRRISKYVFWMEIPKGENNHG